MSHKKRSQYEMMQGKKENKMHTYLWRDQEYFPYSRLLSRARVIAKQGKSMGYMGCGGCVGCVDCMGCVGSSRRGIGSISQHPHGACNSSSGNWTQSVGHQELVNVRGTQRPRQIHKISSLIR